MPLHHRTYPSLGQSDIATSRTSKSHQCFAGLFYYVGVDLDPPECRMGHSLSSNSAEEQS
jgi:hypothetical protein